MQYRCVEWGKHSRRAGAVFQHLPACRILRFHVPRKCKPHLEVLAKNALVLGHQVNRAKKERQLSVGAPLLPLISNQIFNFLPGALDSGFRANI